MRVFPRLEEFEMLTAATTTMYRVSRVQASVVASARRALPAGASTPSWLERLGQWAERQPQHHRMGSWQALGR